MRSRALLAITLITAAIGCRDEGDRELRQDWSFARTTVVAPVIRDSTVYAAFTDGMVAAFDARRGRIRWARQLPREVRSERLLIADSILVVPETQLYGLDLRTGAIRWQYAGPTGTTGISAPALSGDTLFVSDRGGQASAIDARTGQQFWATNVGYVPFTPTLAGDLVLFGGRRAINNVLADGDLVALDRATGVERWRFHVASDSTDAYRGGATNSGLVIGDRVIIGSESAHIYGLDRQTGEERWAVDGGRPGQDAWTYAPIEYGGAAVLMRRIGVLQAHDPLTGALVWSRDLTHGGTTLNGPVRCGNRICLSSRRFEVVGPGGAVEWSYGGGGTGDVFLGEPAVDSAGNVFVGLVRGLDGFLVRFTPPVRIGGRRSDHQAPCEAHHYIPKAAAVYCRVRGPLSTLAHDEARPPTCFVNAVTGPLHTHLRCATNRAWGTGRSTPFWATVRAARASRRWWSGSPATLSSASWGVARPPT